MKRSRPYLLACGLVLALSLQGQAGQQPGSPKTPPGATAKDQGGQHDFDFEIGTWTTRLKRLQRPLTGSTDWVEYEGTSVVRKCGTDAPTW